LKVGYQQQRSLCIIPTRPETHKNNTHSQPNKQESCDWKISSVWTNLYRRIMSLPEEHASTGDQTFPNQVHSCMSRHCLTILIRAFRNHPMAQSQFLSPGIITVFMNLKRHQNQKFRWGGRVGAVGRACSDAYESTLFRPQSITVKIEPSA